MEVLRYCFASKSILFRVAAVVVLLLAGYWSLTAHRAEEEGRTPKTISLRDVLVTPPEKLPKYFILKNAARKSLATVETAWEMFNHRSNPTNADEIFPVYPFSAHDSASIETPKQAAVVFIVDHKLVDTAEIDLSDFGHSLTMKVIKAGGRMYHDERKLFEEQGVTVAPNAFKLTRGYEIPGRSLLWRAWLYWLAAGVLGWTIYGSVKRFRRSGHEPDAKSLQPKSAMPPVKARITPAPRR